MHLKLMHKTRPYNHEIEVIRRSIGHDRVESDGIGAAVGRCGPQPGPNAALARLRILLELREKGVYTSYTPRLSLLPRLGDSCS